MSADTPPKIAKLDELTRIAGQLTPFRLPDASELAGEDIIVGLRRLHPLQLARQGILPERLAALALSSLGIAGAKPQDSPERRGVREITGDVLEMLAATAAAVVAEPALDADQAAAALSVHDLQAIFAWANTEAGQLARFRESADAAVAPVDDRADVEDPAE